MRRALAAAVVVVALASLSGCFLVEKADEFVVDELDAEAFYDMPDDLATGEPGEVIRTQPLLGAPEGAQAWRVAFHTTGQDGGDIPASAVLVVPSTPAPAGGRVVVSWSHPTTGVAPECAPSRFDDPFLGIEGLSLLLAEGFAVVAADYPGMGIPGTSAYLLGVPESNAVLDAARAARSLDQTDASGRLLLWGHSQGGQAALFAAQRAPQYAPELDLLGVAVAAPAADLRALMTDDIVNVSGVTIAAYAVPAYREAYADTYGQAAIDAIFTPEGLEAIPAVQRYCLLTQTGAIHDVTQPLVGRFVHSDPATTEPWATMLAENSVGSQPIGVPVFVGQGLADELVVPSATESFVRSLCERGEHVVFERYDGVNHGEAAYASLPALLPWTLGVLRGDSPSRCGE
ncbi:MAG TPA: alpha/beta fold hydrolase [Rhodoglobus sp.]|nr:alpha/beta fold hydrolase [Rhodoglobus sp.]